MGAKLYQFRIIVYPKVLCHNAISTVKCDLNREHMNCYRSNLHNLTSKIGRTQKSNYLKYYTKYVLLTLCY